MIRKIYVIMVIMALVNGAWAQNYNNILNYASTNAPQYGVKIKTNLPFTPGSQMPTINITGYNFVTAATIDLKLVYYIYSDVNDFNNPQNYFFLYPSMSSAGGYTPTVKLANENGKVIIFIDDKAYFQRFTVSAFATGMLEESSWFQNWATADEPLTGNKVVEIPYSNRFKGDVHFSDSGIWNGSGNVGIGTSTPATKLDVTGVFHVVSPAFSQYTGGQGAYVGWNRSGGGGEVNFVNSKGGGTVSGFAFEDTADGNTFNRLMTIHGNGNVGIGTTGPLAKLDVRGNAFINGSITSSIAAPDIGGTIQINNPAKVASGTASSWQILNMTGAYGNSLQFWAYDNLGCTAGGLCANRLTLMDNGNIGIGTTNPDEKLAVNGKIHAREVRVDAKDWPDYVFKPEYKLPSLNEVEKQIKQNGHLSGIPSANEIESKGLELGELVKQQQKKIEELTLYLIQKEKEINRLKSLEQRVAAIEQLLNTAKPVK